MILSTMNNWHCKWEKNQKLMIKKIYQTNSKHFKEKYLSKDEIPLRNIFSWIWAFLDDDFVDDLKSISQLK
jgi:hypothetical protein